MLINWLSLISEFDSQIELKITILTQCGGDKGSSFHVRQNGIDQLVIHMTVRQALEMAETYGIEVVYERDRV